MKKILLSLSALSFALSVFSQPWVTKASLPGGNGLLAPISFTINHKLYVGGGYTGGQALNTFYEYDPATDVWTAKASIPGGIYSSGCFALNGKGYVACGATPSPTNTVYQYDPANDTWQAKNTFPGVSRQNLGGFSFHGKGYMLGGFTGGSNVSPEVWEYNDTLDSWTAKADMPGQGRNGPAWLVVNDQVFAGLGSNSSGSSVYSDFYRFDPVANTHSQVASIPEGRTAGAYFTLGGLGYVGLGLGDTGYLTSFYKYEPVSDTWQASNAMSRASSNVFSESLDGKPYIGCGSANGTYYNDNWSFAFATSVSDISNALSLSCYPSPTSGSFTVDVSALAAGDRQTTIYNAIGQIVYQTESAEDKIVVNATLASGFYTVAVRQGAQSYTGKVVVK